MNKTQTVSVIIWIALAFIAGIGWGLWWTSRCPVTLSKPEQIITDTPSPTNIKANTTVTSHLVGNSFPERTIVQEYVKTREKVLLQDHELAAEWAELQKERAVQREQLEAAMVKSDPSAASILSKLHAIQKGSLKPSDTQRLTNQNLTK